MHLLGYCCGGLCAPFRETGLFEFGGDLRAAALDEVAVDEDVDEVRLDELQDPGVVGDG